MEQPGSGDDVAKPPSCGARVAFSVFKYFQHGGLQRDLMAIAEELAARSVDVTIFCMIWDAPAPGAGIHFRILEPHGFSNHRKARNFERDLGEMLREEHFDLHVAFNKLAGADWYFAGDLPFVRNRGGWFRRLLPRYRTFAGMEKSVFAPSSNTRVFCITRAQRDAFQHFYGTQNRRLELLPPGIDRKFQGAVMQREARRDAARLALNLDDDDVLLILISSAFRTKGVDRAIAALAALPGVERKRTHLIVVGRGQPAAFRKLAHRFGVENRVMFLGPRDDVPELLAAADLMVHPARNEAAGSALLESLACGTPVLCSGNCGFAPLVAESGGVVLPLPFRQRMLNRTLFLIVGAPGRLEELQREAANYGGNADFYRRAGVAADRIVESLSHGITGSAGTV